MQKLFFVIAIFAGVSAHAAEVRTGVLYPKYQNRPILSLTSSEQREGVSAKVRLMLTRGSSVCDYLKMPAGNFRSRRSIEQLTERYKRDGKLAALERGSNGAITGRWLTISGEEYPEVIKSLRCVGSN